MAFHHRKLLNETISDPGLFNPCGQFCDGSKGPDVICPPNCINLCFEACNYTLLKIPPPLLSPAVDLPDPSQKHHRLPLYLPIVLSILTAAFFFFACYTIYKFYNSCYDSRRRRRQTEEGEPDPGRDEFLDEDHGPVVDHPIWYIRTVGLQPSIIGAITIVRYKRGDGLVEGTDCSVCLNEFQEDETLRLLPKCNHAFHIPCIDTWLRSHTNCPLCRAGIVNNTAVLPSTEPVVQNSGRVDENRAGASLSNRESENEETESRIVIEEDNRDSGAQTVFKINENLEIEEGYSVRGGLDLIQPMRRSVSVDSLSASMISASVESASEGKESISGKSIETNQRFVESLSIEGSSSMKRSLSCSAKVFLSRYGTGGRSRNSVLPR